MIKIKNIFNKGNRNKLYFIDIGLFSMSRCKAVQKKGKNKRIEIAIACNI